MRAESRQFTCFAFYRTWPGTEYCKSEHSDSLSCILLRLFNVLLWILPVFNRAVQASAASKWKCQSAKVPKCQRCPPLPNMSSHKSRTAQLCLFRNMCLAILLLHAGKGPAISDDQSLCSGFDVIINARLSFSLSFLPLARNLETIPLDFSKW